MIGQGLIPDLFAGPGGWSEGLRMLGLSDVGLELDDAACRTRRAAGHLTIRADVSTYPIEPFVGKTWGLIRPATVPLPLMRADRPLQTAQVRARSRMRLLLRYFDFRLVRRRYCESCMKPTVLDHRHTVRFECVIRREWRDS